MLCGFLINYSHSTMSTFPFDMKVGLYAPAEAPSDGTCRMGLRTSLASEILVPPMKNTMFGKCPK